MAKRYMRRKTQITWYGDDVLDIIRKYGDEAWMVAGKHLLAAATRKAPVGRTGNLRKSGYVSTNSASTYVKRAHWRKEKKAPPGGAVVGFTAPHAHLIEGGRRKSGKFGPHKGENPKRALKIGERYVARSRFKRMSSRPFLGPAIGETRESTAVELTAVLRGKLERILGMVRL